MTGRCQRAASWTPRNTLTETTPDCLVQILHQSPQRERSFYYFAMNFLHRILTAIMTMTTLSKAAKVLLHPQAAAGWFRNCVGVDTSATHNRTTVGVPQCFNRRATFAINIAVDSQKHTQHYNHPLRGRRPISSEEGRRACWACSLMSNSFMMIAVGSPRRLHRSLCPSHLGLAHHFIQSQKDDAQTCCPYTAVLHVSCAELYASLQMLPRRLYRSTPPRPQ